MNNDISATLLEQVRRANAQKTPLAIVGGNSKSFYGRSVLGESLLVGSHQGIVDYQPKELVVTVRAGTPLRILESVLAEQGQILAFEPPHFGSNATIGGTIACGFSGPRRPYAGSARDFVLGVRLISGSGEIVKFGGAVMKNVAGYDVSRLVTGALGTLGVILDISLKVLPMPVYTVTLAFEIGMLQALEKMNQWARQPLPLGATCYDNKQLFVRLEGTTSGVKAAQKVLGGEGVGGATEFWQTLKEQQTSYFITNEPLWRISVPPATPPLALPGRSLIEWGGAQRWLISDAPTPMIRAAVNDCGGHATLFRYGNRDGDVFTPLSPMLAQLHYKLKQSFDPNGVLNVGRMYSHW